MMNTNQQIHLCPAWGAVGLDNSFRKWIQNPQKILKPYIKTGMTVLDVGCRPGFFTIEISKMFNGSGKVIVATGILHTLVAIVPGWEAFAGIIRDGVISM